jgi:transposase
MNKKSGTSKDAADKVVKTIRRKTRQNYSAEQKIRIVLAGLRGEGSIAVLCRREGSPRACITVGPRNSSKPVSVGCQAIQRVRRHRRK